MNRLQLRDAVYDRVGVDSSDARLGTAVIDRLVNEAVHMVEAEHEWPWLQASESIVTVAGTGSYTPASNWLRTRYLRIDQDDPFNQREIGELDSRWPDAATRGRPFEYAVDGDVLKLRPIPDTAYTVIHSYVKRESDLGSDSDTPLMPATFHSAIVELAAALAFRKTREDQRAATCVEVYEKFWKPRMLDDRRRTVGSSRVKVRPGGFI